MEMEEAPDTWMAALKDERVDTLPVDRGALEAHLARELRVKIPITERYATLVSLHDTPQQCVETMRKLFVPCLAFTCETCSIVASVVNPPMAGGSHHHLWDSFIGNVLRHASRGSFLHKTSGSSSTDRPDLCFYYDNGDACVFRGVAKSSGRMDITLKALYEKLNWRYDDAPYVFGYAAVGCHVSLVVLRKDSESKGPCAAKAEVIRRYNMTELHDRLLLVLALLNMSTLFRPVVEKIQTLSHRDYGVMDRNNGVRLSFTDVSVVKQYPTSMPSDKIIQNLKDLHRRMKDRGVLNVVSLARSDLKKRRVELFPIGVHSPPSSVKQLMIALRDVLTALVALHHLNIMHRDLRWENVLKYRQGPDRWFLIDFDDGALAPATEGDLHLASESHAPEIRSPHSIEVDIWSVGYLLQTTDVLDLPPQLDALREQCLQTDPAERPNAASLLKVVEQLLKERERPMQQRQEPRGGPSYWRCRRCTLDNLPSTKLCNGCGQSLSPADHRLG